MFQLIGLACAIYLLIKSMEDKKLAHESEKWPTTKATITSIKRNYLNGFPQFFYEYEVNGEKRAGKRLLYAQMMKPAFLKQTKVKYENVKVGDSIDMYYSPTNKNESVVIAGPIPGENMAQWFSIGVIAVTFITTLLYTLTHSY